MREVVVARRGVGGYRHYRIPAMAVVATGRIVVAYDGRPTLADLPSPIDVLVRTSDDHGVTWSPQRVLRTGTGAQGFGDPSLLVDVETGRLFAFYASSTEVGFFSSVVGNDDADDVQQCDLSYSDDDGDTWTHRRITSMLKTGDVAGIFAASGMGIQIHAGPYRGRLVQPMVIRRADPSGQTHGNIQAMMAYSDDHGDTWSYGESIGPADENSIVALSDGTLLMHARSKPNRLVSRSTDGGHTWSPLVAVPALADPADNGGIARADGAPAVPSAGGNVGSDVLVCCHNADPQVRRNVAVRRSVDAGLTWPEHVVVCADSSAYSTCVGLADGSIGVLYERDGYAEIVFTAIEESQWVKGNPPLEIPVVELVPDGVRHRWLGDSDGQRLGTRDSVDRLLGPVRPDLQAGDVVAVWIRVSNPSARDWEVEVAGTVDQPPGKVQVPAGERVLLPVAVQTVTDTDVAGGQVTVSVRLSGDSEAHATLVVPTNPN